MKSPNYSPSIDNVETLKRSGATAAARVGTVAVTPAAQAAAAISIRGSSLSSSVGNNYGDYIAAALRQDLEMARLSTRNRRWR
jgi:hypothetical protein